MSSSAVPDSSASIVIDTKLRVPSPRSDQLIRPELLKLLESDSGHGITLVSAPAGYGKTTLLSQWIHSEGANAAFAWVSLDRQDNDPVRLWRHIVEALERETLEEFGTDVLVALSVARAKLLETALPILVNELGSLSRQLTVVLDDYQFITDNECHESLNFFVEHLPENVRLIIATRSDPPLHLGRLRAKGELNEIRTGQLAFSREEVAFLLNEKLHLRISADDLSVLIERTEGWPAGIYLAILSMEGKKDVHEFIESFGGSNRFILDMLGEEVLAGLSEAEKEFMLRTSVLKKMTGSLCDAVVSREGSGLLLGEIARLNLFVVPLDEHGEWYRYHHLFRDLLLYELRSSQSDLVPILHERASEWFDEAGLFEEAIRHAIAASDYERAGALISRHWFRYAATGQLASLERWLEELPEDLINHDAPLALVKAWMSVLYGRGEESERFLRLAESIPHEGQLPDGSASAASETALIRALFGHGGVTSMVEAALRSAKLESEQGSPWRMALVKMGLGHSAYLSGDTLTAKESAERALAVITAQQPLWRIGALYILSLVATDERRLDEAESLAREARSLVEKFVPRESNEASGVNIALGRVLVERGKLDEAQRELESGLSARRSREASPWPTLIGLLALARVRFARGDRTRARAILDEARAVVDAYPDAGMFPALIERQERELNKRRQRETAFTDELTERELSVLRLFGSEQSHRQIGQSLYISANTVKSHVKSIYRKLGVSSRNEALELAREKTLI